MSAPLLPLSMTAVVVARDTERMADASLPDAPEQKLSHGHRHALARGTGRRAPSRNCHLPSPFEARLLLRSTSLIAKTEVCAVRAISLSAGATRR